MSDETVVTSPETGAGAPETAAAAPSTPSPAPVESGASATTAQQSTPDAQGAAPPDPSTLHLNQDEDPAAFLRRSSEAKNKWAEYQAKQGAKPAEAKPAEKAPEKTPEQKTAEEAQAALDAKAAEEAAKAEAKPATDDPDADPISLDDLAPLPPRELAAKLKENPELDAKLQELGIKDQLFQGQRMAAKYGAFAEQFPGGIEDAQFAKQQAEAFGLADDKFTNIALAAQEGYEPGQQALTEFFSVLTELDRAVDDNGQPLVGADGKPVMQGNVQAFVNLFSQAAITENLSQWEQLAKQELSKAGDDEEKQEAANSLLAAVHILKTRSSGPVTEEMTEAQKAREAELKSREDGLRRQESDAKVAEYRGHEEKIGLESDKTINSEIDAILAKTDLRAEQRPLIRDEIRNAIAAKLEANRLWTSRRDFIMRAKYSPNVEKQRIGHHVNGARGLLRPILRDVLTKYGVKQIADQQARRDKIDTQIKASRSEPRGATQVAAAPKPLSSADVRKTAMENLRKQNADEYDEHLLLREMTRLRVAGA